MILRFGAKVYYQGMNYIPVCNLKIIFSMIILDHLTVECGDLPISLLTHFTPIMKAVKIYGKFSKQCETA